MDGIAILIWLDQLKKLFGFGGKEAFGGDPSINIGLAVSSVVLVFLISWLAMRAAPNWPDCCPPPW